jgi:hypothetical protein
MLTILDTRRTTRRRARCSTAAPQVQMFEDREET